MATTRKTPRKTSGKRTAKNVNGTATAAVDSTPAVDVTAIASRADVNPHATTNGNSGPNGSSEHQIGPRTHEFTVPSRRLEPSFEQIQLRAYQLFVARGGAHGEDANDWFAAERELRKSSTRD
ncbi:MAG: DUF2934 domain-containing protein [Candidatus Binataceae bacterium]